MSSAAIPGTNGAIGFNQGVEAGILNPLNKSIRLFNDVGPQTDVSFFPNGKRLVYVSEGDEIWSATYPGLGQAQKLLDSTAGWGCCEISYPVISPSGEDVYFGTSSAESSSRSIWRFGLKDGQLELIRQDLAMGLRVAISPDGSTIAVTAGDDRGTLQVLFMNSDGSNERFIDTGDLAPGWVDFAPDGERIVFQSSVGEYPDPYRLYEKKLGSSAAPILIDTGTGLSSSSPVYSPDGKFVAFRGYDLDDEGARIYQVRLSDNQLTSLSPKGLVQRPTGWQRAAVAVSRHWKPRSRTFTLETFAPANVRVSGRSVVTSKKRFNQRGRHRITLKLKPKFQRILRSKREIRIRFRISVRNDGEAWSSFHVRRVVKSK